MGVPRETTDSLNALDDALDDSLDALDALDVFEGGGSGATLCVATSLDSLDVALSLGLHPSLVLYSQPSCFSHSSTVWLALQASAAAAARRFSSISISFLVGSWYGGADGFGFAAAFSSTSAPIDAPLLSFGLKPFPQIS